MYMYMFMMNVCEYVCVFDEYTSIRMINIHECTNSNVY
jgi:hypothetical protein